MDINWVKEFDAAITICDKDGIILEMNDKSAKNFANDGGYDLIGKNLFGCHTERSRKILKELFDEQKSNVYTIEKNGAKKLVYQTPWYKNGEMMGFAELVIEIPFEMPHFIRS
jgi:transcriptional regulator with PAS, ATPase and Fis domain